MKVTNEQKIIAGIIVLVAGYVYYRGFAGAAKDVSRAVINVGGGLVSGTTIGIGDAFGIPETVKNQCDIDKKNKSYWDASFSCPAKDYAKFLLTGK